MNLNLRWVKHIKISDSCDFDNCLVDDEISYWFTEVDRSWQKLKKDDRRCQKSTEDDRQENICNKLSLKLSEWKS